MGNPQDNKPVLTDEHVQKILETKTAPRVTQASIEARIRDVAYIQLDAPDDPTKPHGTVCVITLHNGWVSTGFSAPASLENYDADVGRKYAYDNAFKPLWQLEGYLLRERLYWDEVNKAVKEAFVGDPTPVPEHAPQRREYPKTRTDGAEANVGNEDGAAASSAKED